MRFVDQSMNQGRMSLLNIPSVCGKNLFSNAALAFCLPTILIQYCAHAAKVVKEPALR